MRGGKYPVADAGGSAGIPCWLYRLGEFRHWRKVAGQCPAVSTGTGRGGRGRGQKRESRAEPQGGAMTVKEVLPRLTQQSATS